ncbi:MAG: Ku protein [Pseudomonadota bacterium]
MAADDDTPSTPARAIWKGAVTFGLVHIPVALYPLAKRQSLDFDWLDKRTMHPVGYQRIDKTTGKRVEAADIARGIAVEKGRYVILTDEEIKAARSAAVQEVELLAFVDQGDIPVGYFEAPYVLVPVSGAGWIYQLLHDALTDSGKVGIARVVIQTRQHLAALLPQGRALVLNTLRWASEMRDAEALLDSQSAAAAPKRGPARQATERERDMAEQLIADMSTGWDPAQYRDTFRDEILALVERKQNEGEIHAVEGAAAAPASSAEIVDLTELLRKSLRGGAGAGTPARSGRADAAPAEADNAPGPDGDDPPRRTARGSGPRAVPAPSPRDKAAAARSGGASSGARASASRAKPAAKPSSKTVAKPAAKRAAAPAGSSRAEPARPPARKRA